MNVRSNDKEQRILDATVALVAENGLHATPMSQISKRSGVSAGAIYHYFSSKEEIINALYVSVKQAMAQAALRGYDIQLSYEDRFFMMWQNSLDYMLGHPLQLSFTEQCAISPLISAAAQEESARHLAPVLGFLTEGMESGQLKRMPLPLLMALIQGSIVNAAKLQLSGVLEVDETQRAIALQVCWDGLKAA